MRGEPAEVMPVLHSDVGPVHGGLRPAELRALGLRPKDVIDFSASINPLGPPLAVLQAIRDADYARYPDPDCLDLREALAARLGLQAEQVLVGNGSTELIHLLGRAFAAGDAAVTIAAPTFGEYEAAVRAAGGMAHAIRAGDDSGFQPDLAMLRDAAARSALTFLCNPNNPTGVYLSRADVEALLHGHQRPLVIDEAYISFVGEPWDILPLVRNSRVILLRSMTKDYAIPGLRLGYMVAHAETVDRVQRYQTTWSVNAGAQAAGLAALTEDDYLHRARAVMRESKRFLVQELHGLGLEVITGAANFVLVKVEDAPTVRHRLLLQGIAVRDCTSFGLPAYIRIAVRLRPECERLLAALAAVLRGLN